MNLPLDSLLELAGNHARTVLVEAKQRSMVPTWLLISQNGNVMIVGTPWENDQAKQRVRKLMRAHMKKLGVVAYSFVTEAWQATVEPEEIDRATMTLFDEMRRPGNRGDREEVVMACAATATEVKWRTWRIVREATTERIVGLKEKPFGSENPPQGWLCEMLK